MSEIKLEETPTLTFEPFKEEPQLPVEEAQKQMAEAFGTACGTLGLSYGTGGGERCFLSCLKIERDKYVSRRQF